MRKPVWSRVAPHQCRNTGNSRCVERYRSTQPAKSMTRVECGASPRHTPPRAALVERRNHMTDFRMRGTTSVCDQWSRTDDVGHRRNHHVLSSFKTIITIIPLGGKIQLVAAQLCVCPFPSVDTHQNQRRKGHITCNAPGSHSRISRRPFTTIRPAAATSNAIAMPNGAAASKPVLLSGLAESPLPPCALAL